MRAFTLLLIECLTAALAPAADDRDIARQRREIIDGIRTARPDLVTQIRWICFNGREPARVRDARQGGFDFTPDAADSCLAALARKAKDHALLEPYKKLTDDLQGKAETYDQLPKAIGAAALHDEDIVSIGNGKGVKMDAALALDAGFTAAYMGAAPKKEGLDLQKLKAFAESCLDKQKDAGTCFSVGYALGSQAASAR